MKQIGVRLEEELLKKVKKLANDNMITLQAVVSAALEQYVDNNMITNANTLPANKLTNDNNYITREEVAEMIQAALATIPTKEQVVEVIREYDEEGNLLTEVVDEAPVTKLAPEDFYGKIEEKPEYIPDPNDPIDQMLESYKPAYLDPKPKITEKPKDEDEPLW